MLVNASQNELVFKQIPNKLVAVGVPRKISRSWRRRFISSMGRPLLCGSGHHAWTTAAVQSTLGSNIRPPGGRFVAGIGSACRDDASPGEIFTASEHIPRSQDS